MRETATKSKAPRKPATVKAERPSKTPLARRFDKLVAEAEGGSTQRITGLSVEERRKALFEVED